MFTEAYKCLLVISSVTFTIQPVQTLFSNK